MGSFKRFAFFKIFRGGKVWGGGVIFLGDEKLSFEAKKEAVIEHFALKVVCFLMGFSWW